MTDVATTLLREAVSPKGHRVTLTIEKGTYTDAQPYYVISQYELKRNYAQKQRFVPLIYGQEGGGASLSRERRAYDAQKRAQRIFDAYARDRIQAIK